MNNKLVRLGLVLVLVSAFCGGTAFAQDTLSIRIDPPSFFTRMGAYFGKVEAQKEVARAHAIGNGVKKNLAEAVGWWKKAAGKGDTSSAYAVGLCYLYGNQDGIAQDYGEAVQWLKKAALAGDAWAAFTLGLMADLGVGLSPAPALAAKWYLLAAQKRHEQASTNLGLLYYYGSGVPQNYEEALKWFRIAGEQPGNGVAWYHLGIMLAGGQWATPDYSLAMKWLLMASEKNIPEAYTEIARFYYVGKGVKTDLTEAYKWYRRAADLDEVEAQMMLSQMLDGGVGVARNQEEAVLWSSRATATKPNEVRYKRGAFEDFLHFVTRTAIAADQQEAQEKASEERALNSTDEPEIQTNLAR